jgi:nucleotide-binding universal stress UspA family protein
LAWKEEPWWDRDRNRRLACATWQRVRDRLASEHDAYTSCSSRLVDVVRPGLQADRPPPHELSARDRKPLDDALALAAEADVDARAELLRGDPVDEIVAFADSFEADLIVVGSRGHGALASALLGSVSRGILSETRRPVLVVRGAAERIAAVAVPA